MPIWRDMYGVITPADRARSALGAGVVAGLLGYALVVGLGFAVPPTLAEQVKRFALVAEPERPPPIPPRVRSHRPEGRASPPNLRARATAVVAPPPLVPPIVPPPMIAAPIAGPGTESSAGAADSAGPGTGAGGIGDGFGAGGDGDGDGGGADDDTPPRQRKGGLYRSDYPDEAGDRGFGGTVSVRYSVETNGHVGTCSVTRSSGNAALDETTCRLIKRRFRFDPSHDGQGRPVRSIIVQNHEWAAEVEPPPPPPASR